jgi:hypothetical protein
MITLIALIVLVILLGLVIYAQVVVVTKQENDTYDAFWDEEPEQVWTMHHTEYVNRYNDKIYFVQINSNQIQMTFETDYYRVAYAKDDSDTDLYMIDPSGGPAIFVGTDMVSIYHVWKNCIVSSITQEHNKHYILTFQKIEK